MNSKTIPSSVILDTNALLMQFQFGIDLENELLRLLGAYEVIIPSSVIYELNNIRNRHAKAALRVAGNYRVIETEIRGDESILNMAKEMNAYVLTNDKALRKRLKEDGVRVIYLRQKSYLALDFP